MSLLDDAPRPPADRRPLRYQKVIDLVDEIIRTHGPAARATSCPRRRSWPDWPG